jgi:hypothetical protein
MLFGVGVDLFIQGMDKKKCEFCPVFGRKVGKLEF